jgi:hypothetical protein
MLPKNVSPATDRLIANNSAMNPAFEAGEANNGARRQTDFRASICHSTAKSSAHILSTIPLDGQMDEVQLLSRGTMGPIPQELIKSQDQISTVRYLVFGLTCALARTDAVADCLADGCVCFWYGYGALQS